MRRETEREAEGEEEGGAFVEWVAVEEDDAVAEGEDRK